MMKYIFVTYEAILQFASDRFLQTAENEASRILCKVLRQEQEEWSHPTIFLHYTDNGAVFFASGSGYKEGLVFDLETFSAFMDEKEDRSIINIFQKTIKYAIRYFDNLPPASCERIITNSSITLIFPNPFAATHDVLKILVDRNSSKLGKKECNYLTVYGYSTDGKKKFSNSNTIRAYNEVRLLNFNKLASSFKQTEPPIRGFTSTELGYKDLKLDSHVGYEHWLSYYLTDTQKDFVTSNNKGPERLEGAAGTGKTLCLILRCIYILKKHIEEDKEFHIIFFTHSMSTKEKIIDIFQSNWEYFELCEEQTDNTRPKQSIFVTTLQEWSAEHLGTNSISDNEFLDKDASVSKNLQIYYIDEAYKQIKEKSRESIFELLCSERFKNFVKSTSEEHFLELLRQEIAVLIKGRASEEYDVYKNIPRPKYSLPLVNDADFKYVYSIYKQYQDSLMRVGQYDSDDITLTALGQVRTPIWNRRRIKEGYDLCVIDETHLFNINELSVFHHINKPSTEASSNIIFAIDRSQATGDWGIDDVSIANALGGDQETIKKQLHTVFRCSPDIVNLAFNILSSGANLFTNFENPLNYTSFDFVKEEEQKTMRPEYTLVENDEKSIEVGVQWAENFCSEKGGLKSNVLLIGTSDFLVKQIENQLKTCNKPFESLQSRSDVKAIKKAMDGNKFVVSSIEYVGGLEFDAVVIIGVDEGRVPPIKSSKGEAYHVLNYAWHSKMYVAVTRAKYAIKILGESSRGPCEFLFSSICTQTLDYDGPSICGME